jgi:hypothetical protein
MRIGVAAVRTRPMSKGFVTKASGLGRLDRLVDRLVGRSSMEGRFVGSDRPNPGADETVSDAEQEPEAVLFARMGGAP